MDSEVQRDGRVLDLTDDAWREDRLPYEDVTIPLVSPRLEMAAHSCNIYRTTTNLQYYIFRSSGH